LAYLHAGRAYFIAITIEGSNSVSARIGQKRKTRLEGRVFDY
jgi:hypothetical protein